MPATCNRKNPLIRSGTQQGERQRPALAATYFGVDERATSDLILFAERFSHHLQYYKTDNTPDGDWSPFFRSDISAILAGLSELPTTLFQGFARNLQTYLTDDATRPDDDLRAHFKLLLHLPLLLLKEAGEHFDRLPQDHPLRLFMLQVIERDIAEPLADVVSYYKGAAAIVIDVPTDKRLIDEASPLAVADYNTTFANEPRIQLPSAITAQLAGSTPLPTLPISARWLAPIAAGGWAAYYATITPDTSPYEDSTDVYNRIYDALTYNLLDKALERLFQALQRIALEATTYLAASLTDFPGHTPHYALWLAFLRLFEFSQAQLNTLTQRHLDYYYKEVLQLCLQPPRPAQVHLLFTLNKNVQDYLLPAATTFLRAGKDASDKEALYQLDNDFVVNRAKVNALKSLYRPPLVTTEGSFVLPYAAAVANSSDGAGAALPKENPAWPPFGPGNAAPTARIGFAIADRRLFLREGTRNILLFLQPATTLPSDLSPMAFKALLTGEKGWLEFADPTKIITTNFFGSLLILVVLDGEDPPVVPYNALIHGENYPVAEPMLKIEFNFTADASANAKVFSALNAFEFQVANLIVAVEDVRNVTLQNDSGVIDSAKPFLPFGPTPTQNAPLILGSSELFSKRLAELTLHIEWATTLAAGAFFNSPTPTSHQARLRHLKTGSWVASGSGYDITLFSNSGVSLAVPLTGISALSSSVAQTLENEAYSPKSQSGFIKLELEASFAHQEYIDAKTLALIAIAGGDNTASLPSQPYTPKINEFSISYNTTSDAPARFFHLHPFGFKEESNSSGRLLPPVANEGELYIGIADLAPPQRLTLLFQVVDGTANPLKEETTLQWHYLRGDEWVEFAEQFVDDKTHNLTGSGIVGLAMPADADTVHNLLPGGLHWLRMAAATDSDALNQLLRIDAQAASASFVDQGNDPAFLATPLAPGVISKLKTSVAAIKQISQPFASFGGKPQESETSFSVRVSERLRHKDRAITMWDYEHLILQAFPHIYKVRCINHTQLLRDVSNNILADNEVRPGHVLVVTIPYVQVATVRVATGRDPLRPYTDKKTLGEIDRFLRQRISPFVQLEVQNPKFEEVQVQCKVAFTAEIADIAFYLSELNAAIIRYLSPWAYADGVEISFGGKWHKSAIIDFIEEQSYVDYLKDVEMYHKVDSTLSDSLWVRIDEEVVEATTARSILVSHPLHVLTPIS